MSDAEKILLRRENRRLKEILKTMNPGGGENRSLYGTVDADGTEMDMGTFFESGMNAVEGFEVQVICLAAGLAYGIDRTGRTGLLGLARGVSGEILSKVDVLPSGTVEVDSEA